MIVTFNQIAYFKPATTARRLKAYYHSETMRPEVFLNYLRLINIVATLCPNVAQLSVELFFLQKDNPTIIKHLWRFRSFFTAAECCRLLQKAVLETGTVAGKNEKSVLQLVPGAQSALIFVDFYRINGASPGIFAHFPAKDPLFFGQSS